MYSIDYIYVCNAACVVAYLPAANNKTVTYIQSRISIDLSNASESFDIGMHLNAGTTLISVHVYQCNCPYDKSNTR
jgi:hypothetical protein